MQAQREPMSAVDTAWLRMEGDNNLMMISGVLLLESALDVERFKQVLESRFLCFRRFRQRVVREGDKYFWEDDASFNLDHHLHRVGLPGAADKAEPQKFASDLTSTPLDFKRPLWQMHVVENYLGDAAAVIIRIHHCIADGLSLVRVLLSITDEQVEGDAAQQPHGGWVGRVAAPANHLVEKGLHLGHELLEESLDLLQHPSHLLDLAKRGLEIASELTHIGLLPSDTRTRLKGQLSGRKNVAWAEPLALEQVRQVAHRLNGTINDILLAAATGALRKYLLEEGEDTLDGDIHVAVPFNLRPLDRPIESLGNQFGLVIVRLPVGERHPLDRFRAVQRHMLDLKKSYQAKVFYGMLSVLGRGPSVLEQTALEVLSKKASLVMTNVPGPTKPLYLAGSRVLQPLVWVPQSGEVGVGLSILSYAGDVQFGLVADQQLISDPDRLVAHFEHCFQELAALPETATVPA